jgi:hypothetical protein
MFPPYEILSGWRHSIYPASFLPELPASEYLSLILLRIVLGVFFVNPKNVQNNSKIICFDIRAISEYTNSFSGAEGIVSFPGQSVLVLINRIAVIPEE